MSKSLADNPFITEMKDKNGDSWYHQIVLELKDKEIERLNKLIDYKGIEDIPQYVSDLEVDNKQLKEENQLLNKNYNIINKQKREIERLEQEIIILKREIKRRNKKIREKNLIIGWLLDRGDKNV